MIYIYIPAFNEEKNIGPILDEVRRTLDSADLKYRLVVVNDASTDRTSEILEEYAKTMPLEVVAHEKNLDQGGAFRSGISKILDEAVDDDFIITLDADSSHQPSNILGIYDKLLDGRDVVVASRYRRGGDEWGAPRYRIYLAKLANWLLHQFFPIEEVSDYTGSFRGFRASAFRKAWGDEGVEVLKENDFTVVPEVLLCLRGKGLTFTEIPLILRYDLKREKTKIKVRQTLKATSRLIWRRMLGGLKQRRSKS